MEKTQWIADNEKQFLRVARITPVSQSVRAFRLEPAQEGAGLAEFKAGQYINFFYQIGNSTTTRPYSIASSPKDAQNGYYDIFIHNGGFTSSWLFRHCNEGDLITTSLPCGDFCYEPTRDKRHIIGISGGLSVAPLRSMARAVLDNTLDIDFTMFCCWDSSEDTLFIEEFQHYHEICPRFHAIFTILNGELPVAEQGYMTLEIIQKYTDTSNTTFFVCGPTEMYTFLARELAPLNIPPVVYHTELPGEIKTPCEFEDYRGGKNQIYTLTAISGGTKSTLPMNSQETVLVSLERSGLFPPSRCRSGQCGYCVAELKGGEIFVPEHWDARTPEEHTQSLIHPCCSFPMSDLTLRLL